MGITVIADRVRVARRYSRAIDLPRDFDDPQALDGYVVTPCVREAAIRLMRGLDDGSAQRAFRITGPYGSGKSAFALLIARLLAEHEKPGPATAILRDHVQWEGSIPAYYPLLLVGRRTSFVRELIGAVLGAASRAGAMRSARVAKTAQELLDLPGGPAGHLDLRRLLDLIDAYALHLKARTGRGLLILVDEMGRFLEHTASNGSTEDPSIYQLLAERAGGRSGAPVAVVGLLHNRFSDYAAGLGAWAEAEWARSAERYEEVTFQSSTEQTLHLVGQALLPSEAHNDAVADSARQLYRQARERNVFTTSKVEIEEVAPTLFPLHPATVACLAASTRRFGQNERSVFSFLTSLEPHGLQRYMISEPYDVEHWYRLPSLFDYIASQGAIRLQSGDRERRWQLALDAVLEGAKLDDDHVSVIKTVALLAVLEPITGLRSDVEGLAWCLGRSSVALEAQLALLCSHNLLYRRPHRGDYNLWSSTSVDLADWLERGRAQIPVVTRITDSLALLPPLRPLVAHRHYHETGTLRAFQVRIASEGSKSEPGLDGGLVIVPVHPDEDNDQVVARTRDASAASGPLTVFKLRRIGSGELTLARELALWEWIKVACGELRVDDLARREVDQRIADATQALQSLLSPLSRPAEGIGEDIWFHNGCEIAVDGQGGLSRLLSEICDSAFYCAPVIRNELVNRSKLSSAVASARMRLLERMLSHAETPTLALDGAPPEKTIYLTLFQASGLHRRMDNGTIGFCSPPEDDPLRWRPAWDFIDRLLTARSVVSFQELMEELAAPPYGVRSGPALLAVVAFMLHNRRRVAFFEKNSFQPEVSSAHFMRLNKSPANFSLRLLTDNEGTKELLTLFANELDIWTEAERPKPEIRAIAEQLFSWWNNLSLFALETQQLADRTKAVRTTLRKAREPIELVYDALPKALELKPGANMLPRDYVERLNLALQELSDAEPQLRSRATAATLDAFGVNSITSLREQVESDYGPVRLQLSDYRLRAFVDRAADRTMSDARWLDGLVGLVIGRRLENWTDATLDEYSFEVRSLAQRLARWLSLTRTEIAARVPLVSVHVVATSGEERSVVVRKGAAVPKLEKEIAELRRILDQLPDAEAVLSQLLAERMPHSAAKEKVK